MLADRTAMNMPKISKIDDRKGHLATQYSMGNSNIIVQCATAHASKADGDCGSCTHSLTGLLLRKLSTVSEVLYLSAALQVLLLLSTKTKYLGADAPKDLTQATEGKGPATEGKGPATEGKAQATEGTGQATEGKGQATKGTDLVARHLGLAPAARATYCHFFLTALCTGCRAGPLVTSRLTHVRAFGQSLMAGLATAKQLTLVCLRCLHP